MLRFLVLIVLATEVFVVSGDLEAQLFRRGRIFSGRETNQNGANGQYSAQQQRDYYRQQQLAEESQRKLESDRRKNGRRNDRDSAKELAEQNKDAGRKTEKQPTSAGNTVATNGNAKRVESPAVNPNQSQTQLVYDPRTNRYYQLVPAATRNPIPSAQAGLRFAPTAASQPAAANQLTPASPRSVNSVTMNSPTVSPLQATKPVASYQQTAPDSIPLLQGPIVESSINTASLKLATKTEVQPASAPQTQPKSLVVEAPKTYSVLERPAAKPEKLDYENRNQ